ncbi:MAG TPA: type II toxin-antitoxin system VapC family toxin [Terriglobia bacterium]|nr:type II toxin-antitoxin system VapC family toxin [Terriglobia bacterium]
MIVIDASAVLEVLLQTPASPRISRRMFASGETLHAPHLLDVEVAQVLRRYVRSKDILPERGAEALADLASFPINRYPHFVLLPRIWQLRHNLTAYDAAYIALAEALDATLVTRDRALKSLSSAARVEVL